MILYSILETRELVCTCPVRCSCAHEDTPPSWTERKYKWDPEARRRTNIIVREGTPWQPKFRTKPHHDGCNAPFQDHHPDCPNSYPQGSHSWVSAIELSIQRISITPLNFEIPVYPQTNN